MTTLALLNPAHDAVLEHPLSQARLWQLCKGWHNLRGASDETLASLDLARVVDEPRPAAAWGETVVEVLPAYSDGAWRRTWQVAAITLPEAKQRLAEMVSEIYWQKVVLDAPPPALLDSEGNAVGVIQARQASLAPKLAQVKADIIGASTIAEAYAIYLTLEQASA